MLINIISFYKPTSLLVLETLIALGLTVSLTIGGAKSICKEVSFGFSGYPLNEVVVSL